MSTINLSVDLNELNSDQVQALSNFVSSFDKFSAVTGEQNAIKVDISEEAKEEPVKKTRAKKNTTVQAGEFAGQERTESVADEYQAAANLTVVDATDAEDDDIMGDTPATAKAYSLDDVRELVKEKAVKHRELIKNSIPDYGGTNVATIPASKYPAFVEFLNGLK